MRVIIDGIIVNMCYIGDQMYFFGKYYIILTLSLREAGTACHGTRSHCSMGTILTHSGVVLDTGVLGFG